MFMKNSKKPTNFLQAQCLRTVVNNAKGHELEMITITGKQQCYKTYFKGKDR